MDHCRYTIVGGGLSGLSLAYYLKEYGVSGDQVRIIDPEKKTKNDRTWCFWSADPGHLAPIIKKSWNSIGVFKEDRQSVQSLQNYQYYMIHSSDYYGMIWKELEQWDGFEFIQEKVTHITDNEERVFIQTENKALSSDFVFDSRFRIADVEKGNETTMYQHFKGFYIQTKGKGFDSEVARLMDFQENLSKETSFFYVLPWSDNEALVEYTIFSSEMKNRIEADKKISDYLKKEFGIIDYDITHRRSGTIPMSANIQPRHSRRHVFIGTAGGAVKPSSGYAFANIQSQMNLLAEFISSHGYPEPGMLSRKIKFQFYDTLLLRVLSKGYISGNEVFWTLLSRNRMDVVFRFLSERTSILEESRLFFTLPWRPFLKALYGHCKARFFENLRAKQFVETTNPGR